MPLAGTDIRVVDADTHLAEPPDLWTSRFPRRHADEAPRVVDDGDGNAHWHLAGRTLNSPTWFAQGTDHEPMSWDEIDPACYDGPSRLRWMDEFEIDIQVVYPNIVAFESFAVMATNSSIQKLIFQAYNDHLHDFASSAPHRFILIAALPFWDMEGAIEEMRRCRDMGFRGVLWAAQMEKHGLPAVTSPAWDRFYAAAQDLDMSINFHVGIGKTEGEMDQAAFTAGHVYDSPRYAMRSALAFMSNTATIADVLMSGICDRFPMLNFVSVESGFGYVPYLLEALDWQWVNSGGTSTYRDRLLPSEYFKRQVYTMFWFEKSTLPLLELYPDNVMFETDFPHGTSLSPRPYLPQTIPAPNELVREHLSTYSEELMRKVLYDNAARLYRLGV